MRADNDGANSEIDVDADDSAHAAACALLSLHAGSQGLSGCSRQHHGSGNASPAAGYTSTAAGAGYKNTGYHTNTGYQNAGRGVSSSHQAHEGAGAAQVAAAAPASWIEGQRTCHICHETKALANSFHVHRKLKDGTPSTYYRHCKARPLLADCIPA